MKKIFILIIGFLITSSFLVSQTPYIIIVPTPINNIHTIGDAVSLLLSINDDISGSRIIVTPVTVTETSLVTIPANVSMEIQGATVNFNQGLNINNGTVVTVSTSTLNFNQDLNINNGAVMTVSTGATLNFNQNLNINSGAVMTVSTGATLNFNQNLNINSGTLITFGDITQNKIKLCFRSTARLIITSSSTTSFFHTIFQGTSTSSYWGGISISGSNISFECCEILNYNSLPGMSVSSANIRLRKTWFQTMLCGIYLLNYSTGNVLLNNIFKCRDHHIYNDENSHFFAGNQWEYGHNSFRESGSLLSEYPGTLNAQYNYWAVPNIIGNIIVNPTLSPDPNPIIKQGYVYDDHQTDIESGIFLKKSVVKDDEPIEKVPGIEELDEATELYYSKKYDEALVEMHRLVNEYKDGFVGKRALVFIENILTETFRVKEILPMLEQYSNGKSKVAQFAEYRKGYQYFHLGEYSKGIEIMKSIEFNEENADLRQARLYDLGVAYHNLLNQKEEAYYYFNELMKTYPDCQLAKMAAMFYNEDGYNGNGISKYEEEIVIPTETKLFANYPNPFNPSTVIKYQLADASQVSLKVYDVMGREVAMLVDSYQNQGSYDVTFNANGLASGIYFYKLNAGGKQFINKMLLMK